VTYDVEVNGRTRQMDVQRSGTDFLVTVDGRRHRADVTVIDGVWSLILAPDTGTSGARRSYEIAVVEHPRGSGRLAVHVDGRVVVASVGATRPRSGHRRDEAAAGAAAAPKQVTAPMPGKVVKLLVQPGDVVAARQGIVVVEAMKMENELRAPRAGRVAEIRVTEGASVEAGAVLAVIE
jgi:biotin carboxyl carrier protein